jgi:membrane protease YdiL (CAAX protease family)
LHLAPVHAKGCFVARFVWVTLGSALLGLIGVSACLLLGRSPISRAPWLDTSGIEAVVVSIVLGGCIAGITVLSSRFLVRRYAWARALHSSLRPLTRGQSNATLTWMAVASGLGEELFFRGLLAPSIGIVLSSLAFGLLHQVRGEGRWAWAGWAAVLGASLAVLYALTGQLVGPIAAHVAINAANLRFLRDTPVDPQPPRRLGGLYSTRS